MALGHSSAALENTCRGYLFSTVFINDLGHSYFNSFINIFTSFYGLTVWNSLMSAPRQQPLTGHSSDEYYRAPLSRCCDSDAVYKCHRLLGYLLYHSLLLDTFMPL